MSLFDTFKTNLTRVKERLVYSKFLSGQTPVFSQFGSDVYVSDVVQQCMGCITEEMRKVQINHVRISEGQEVIQNDSLNRLFEYGVNEYMTTSDFMEQITYLLIKNMNAYIYPVFSYKYNTEGFIKSREVVAIYPLNPKKVEFLQDDNGRMFVRMTFGTGEQFYLPYDNLVHWRMRYSENEYMGGNISGEAEVTDLLHTVQINDKLMQGLGIAVEKSMQIQGILKMPQYMDDEAQIKEAERFEKKISKRGSGIVPMDAKSDYVPIKIDPKMIDKDTLEFIDKRILRHFGCSLPVLNGVATPEEQQAFYQRTIEPKIISLAQALTKTLFTSTEYGHGNRVKIYPEELIFLSTNQKLEFVKMAADRGALTNNKILSIFGLPPYDGGDVRLQSLNYVDVSIANQYQLTNAGGGKEKGLNNGEE